MVEVLEDEMIDYDEKFREVLPQYNKDPIDFYISHGIKPQVYKYHISLLPILNGRYIDFSPILFEPGDSLDVKLIMQRHGTVDFNEYMRFLHEAYKSETINVENEYSGTWSFVM